MLVPTDPLPKSTEAVAPRPMLLVQSGRAWWALATAVLLLALGTAPLVGGIAGRSAAPVAHHRLDTQGGLSSLPLRAQGPVSATLGADAPAYLVATSGTGLKAQNPAQHLNLRFVRSGIQVRSAQTRLGLSLRAVGYGGSLEPVGAVRPSMRANRVTYARPRLSEWYANGPLGLEQGFTLPHAPSHPTTRPLTLSMALSGNARPSVSAGGQSLTFSDADGTALRYSGLVASDARGRTLHSWLALHGRRLILRVDARGARYPVRIDPLFQQGEKLTASDESGKGHFGHRVALSADGNTALIGGLEDNKSEGAAWVFIRSKGQWTQQGPKLTGAGESGEGRFGSSVALSADGNTALIGGYTDSSATGAAWVFTRAKAKWTQQGSKLTADDESGEGLFGGAVALSSDGNTALIGGFADGSEADKGIFGAAWVFTRAEGKWTQQGAKLTGGGETGEGEFGRSAALSADGNTALIGGMGDNGFLGAAWVFTRAEGKWTQQGSKLTGSGESVEGSFGAGVALGADGDTALIGGPNDNHAGSAWVFVRSEGQWTQQGSKLIPSGNDFGNAFGAAVALSLDGNTALIGAPGVTGGGGAWVFTRAEGKWAQQGSTLTGSGESGGNAQFGGAVALSSDGRTLLLGGEGDNAEVGAAWAFVPGEITRVAPNKGPAGGGTKVTITGTAFTGVTTVTFGSVSAASFTVVSPTTIVAESPSETARAVDLTVTTSSGTTPLSSLDHFKFGPPTVTGVSPNTGAVAGGATVTIAGTGFGLGTEATLFKFGSTQATAVNCTSITACTVVAPSHAAGTVHVTAIVSGQKSPKVPIDQFTYM
jgi:hypothetical protein